MTKIATGLLLISLLTPCLAAAQNSQTRSAPQGQTDLSPLLSLTVDEVLEKYVHAIGGKEAYRRLKSRASKGTFTSTRLKAKGAAEIYEKAPNKRLTVLRAAGFGTYRQGFNGVIAWEQQPGSKETQELLGFTKRDESFYKPVTLHEIYPKLAYVGGEKLGGRTTHVLEAPRGGQPKRWFFDAETGLLLRTEVRNAAGQLIESEEYGDYRLVDSTRLPFSVRRLDGDGTDINIRLAEVKHNVALEDALFEKPLGPPGGTAQIQDRPGARIPSSAPRVVERGTFKIYETKQVQGEESYEVTREGGGLLVKSKFDLPLWGEEVRPSLTATLRTSRDLTPERFEIKGVKATEVKINTSVEVRGRVADVREGDRTRQVSVPERFFTLAGYAPVTLEMMLVRYWLSHRQKDPLKILPGGEAIIERRGADTVTVGGRQVKLERYSLGGVVWGRQTLWLDAAKQLAAIVNIGGDVETNFSAIREGYEASLPFFLKRAAEDGVDRLTQTGERLSAKRTGALVLLGATLIDGTGKPPINDSAIVIEGDRITAAGARSQVAIPKGATVVDAAGKYVLPGLWDMHAHLYQVEFGPAYLAAGITSARDVGNDIEFATTLRDAARQGRGLQPRLLLAGYIDGKNDLHSFDVQVDTPEEARAAVRRYKDAGYEQIKIRDHVKTSILAIIADEAHRLGMTLVGHVPKGMDAVQAVEAGMDQISHLNYVATAFETKEDDERKSGERWQQSKERESPKRDEQSERNEQRQESGPDDFDYPEARRAIRVFKEHGTVLDPTVATLELFIRPKNEPLENVEPGFKKVAPELVRQLENKGLPPEAAPKGREAMRQLLSLLGALHRAGIPVVAGTDVSVPGHSLHRELELYVQAGFMPLEAIQAATLVPARVMGLDQEIGTVEAGKRADVIVLDANPLENISNIRTVRFVVAQGRLYDSARLWQSVDFRP